MAKHSDLFELIKAMTKAEKRYFRLFTSSSRGEKNYLRLFGAIDKQKEYNEDLIKKRFKGQPFVKQLHVTKNYLYRLILKSLRNYHQNVSIDAELKDLLRDVEVLFKKELVRSARDLLTKAKRLALQYEKYPSLIEIPAWEIRIQLMESDSFQRRDQLRSILKEQGGAMEKLETINQYWLALFELMADIAGAGTTANRKLDTFLKKNYMRNEDHADSYQARIMYYHILYTVAVLQSDLPKADKSISDLITWIESHPEQIEDDPSSYVTALNNKITLSLQQKKLKEIPTLLNQIRQLPERFRSLKRHNVAFKLLLRTYNLELEMHRDAEKFEQAKVVVEQAKAFLRKYKHNVPDEYRLLLYYQFAYVYFADKNFSNALTWLNEILNKQFRELRTDIQSFARMLNLIVHFELGHRDGMKHLVDSSKRFIQKRRRLYEYEQALLGFFSKVSITQPEYHPFLFRELKAKVFVGKEQKIKAEVLDYLNFEKWIDDHLARERV